MDLDPGTLTLAAVLTATGATAAAALITGIIAVLKTAKIPGVDGNEPRWVLALAGALVVFALVSAVSTGMALSLEFVFVGVVAWYAITRLAMAIHDDVSRAPRSLTNQSG